MPYSQASPVTLPVKRKDFPLQRQDVPSRLLYFPDEGHFVTKPRNARLWLRTMLDWLAHYLK